MKKSIITLIALLTAALAFTATATAAKPDGKGTKAKNDAAKLCTAEKKADRAAFKATYGKHAMRSCIKGETPEARAERRSASKDCRAERAEDRDAFRDKYSTKKGRNAMGKCVSSQVRQDRRKEVAEFKNAAKECKSERIDDPDAFRDEYGTKKGRNALGKCVSSKVRDNGEEPPAV